MSYIDTFEITLTGEIWHHEVEWVVFYHLYFVSFYSFFKGIRSILFGRRGPLIWRICARQEKKFDISNFLLFPPTSQKNKYFFLQNVSVQVMRILTHFLSKNLLSWLIFLIFTPTWIQGKKEKKLNNVLQMA